MANATTHPTDKVLKMFGGLYGEEKRGEDLVSGFGGVREGNLEIYSVIIQVAIRFIKEYRMWKEVRVSNCWYGRELS